MPTKEIFVDRKGKFAREGVYSTPGNNFIYFTGKYEKCRGERSARILLQKNELTSETGYICPGDFRKLLRVPPERILVALYEQERQIKSHAQSSPSSEPAKYLRETTERLEATPDVPSRLLKHPYFLARAKKKWGGVDSWLKPKLPPKRFKLSSPK